MPNNSGNNSGFDNSIESNEGDSSDDQTSIPDEDFSDDQASIPGEDSGIGDGASGTDEDIKDISDYVDFVVEIESGRDIRVLQLTDVQTIS